MTDFETFWQSYPRKVGRLAAEKAYAKARGLATPEQLLTGLDAYKRTKPAYADWCHAKTWLNEGRWLDEVPQVAYQEPWACPHDPRCLHPTRCRQLIAIAREKAQA
jgi:hypothetical protein